MAHCTFYKLIIMFNIVEFLQNVFHSLDINNTIVDEKNLTLPSNRVLLLLLLQSADTGSHSKNVKK